MKKTRIKKGKKLKVTKGSKTFERNCDVDMVVYSPDSDVVQSKNKKNK